MLTDKQRAEKIRQMAVELHEEILAAKKTGLSINIIHSDWLGSLSIEDFEIRDNIQVYRSL